MSIMQPKNIFRLFVAVLTMVVLMQIIGPIHWQSDLTLDKRYTLSSTTRELIESIDQPIIVDVMLGGDLPPSYQRLRSELTVLLKQLSATNEFIQYNFINPFEDIESKEQLIEDLYRFGLPPEVEVDQESQSTEQTIVVPWLILNKQNDTNLARKSIRVSLLQKNLGDTPEQRIEQSIQQLEYNIIDGLHRLFIKEKKALLYLVLMGAVRIINLRVYCKAFFPIID